MRTLRFRLTGDSAACDVMMSTLSGMPHVQRVEETGDLMGGMREDSSSYELSDDDTGDVHDIEVRTSSSIATEHVRDAIEQRAMQLGVAVEFVEDF